MNWYNIARLQRKGCVKMQNRKYQVFISSTYSDLVEERKKFWIFY